VLFAAAASGVAKAQSDPSPSWNYGATKKSVIDFVARVGTDFAVARAHCHV
jgi:hypothetical protein